MSLRKFLIAVGLVRQPLDDGWYPPPEHLSTTTRQLYIRLREIRPCPRCEGWGDVYMERSGLQMLARCRNHSCRHCTRIQMSYTVDDHRADWVSHDVEPLPRFVDQFYPESSKELSNTKVNPGGFSKKEIERLLAMGERLRAKLRERIEGVEE